MDNTNQQPLATKKHSSSLKKLSNAKHSATMSFSISQQQQLQSQSSEENNNNEYALDSNLNTDYSLKKNDSFMTRPNSKSTDGYDV